MGRPLAGKVARGLAHPLRSPLLSAKWTSLVAQTQSISLRCGRSTFNPWVGPISWRRKWHPTLLPGKSHGWRHPVGYSLGVAKSRTQPSDVTFFLSFTECPPWSSPVLGEDERGGPVWGGGRHIWTECGESGRAGGSQVWEGLGWGRRCSRQRVGVGREMQTETQVEVRASWWAWDNSSAGSQEAEAESWRGGPWACLGLAPRRRALRSPWLCGKAMCCRTDRQTSQHPPRTYFMPGSPCFFHLNFLICKIRVYFLFLCVILSWQLWGLNQVTIHLSQCLGTLDSQAPLPTSPPAQHPPEVPPHSGQLTALGIPSFFSLIRIQYLWAPLTNVYYSVNNPFSPPMFFKDFLKCSFRFPEKSRGRNRDFPASLYPTPVGPPFCPCL